MSIRKGSVWRFKGLNTNDTFVVVQVGSGAHGTVWYKTVGVKEKPTSRKRSEFLENFEPAQ